MTDTTITNAYRLHDERLLELLQVQAQANQKVEWAADTLRHIAGQKKSYRSRSVFTWCKSRTDGTYATVQDAIEVVQAKVAEGDDWAPSYSGRYSKFLGQYNDAVVAWAAAHEAVVFHESLYTGWQRYWLCCSSNGHVHHAHCSSFRLTTRIALVPSLSGASVEAAVLSLGPIVCSKCFPEAPTEWGDSKIPESVITVLYEQGEPAFREALAAWQAKQAAKAAKS
jgi:hypothetical protein